MGFEKKHFEASTFLFTKINKGNKYGSKSNWKSIILFLNQNNNLKQFVGILDNLFRDVSTVEAAIFNQNFAWNYCTVQTEINLLVRG